jgi:hypothetical protein
MRELAPSPRAYGSPFSSWQNDANKPQRKKWRGRAGQEQNLAESIKNLVRIASLLRRLEPENP